MRVGFFEFLNNEGTLFSYNFVLLKGPTRKRKSGKRVLLGALGPSPAS